LVPAQGRVLGTVQKQSGDLLASNATLLDQLRAHGAQRGAQDATAPDPPGIEHDEHDILRAPKKVAFC
jgi:hypothetical protein